MAKPITKPNKAGSSVLRTDFFCVNDQTFGGYVVDLDDLQRRFVVEMLLDGLPLRLARADAYANELAIEGLGDACYGFAFNLSQRVIDSGTIVEVRLANTDIPVGHPISIKEQQSNARQLPGTSEIRWLGGLRFDGWCSDDGADAPIVTAVIDGERIAEAKATRWANIGNGRDARLARRFDLHLPARFADGHVKHVQFVRDNGENFPGGPIAIVAFADGLARTIDNFNALAAERPRAAEVDRLLPMSMPFSAYADWLVRFPIATPKNANLAPIAVALLGSGDPKPSLKSLQKSQRVDWVAATLPEAGGQSEFVNEHLQQFLLGDARNSEYVVFTRSGTRFTATALDRIAGAFAEFPNAFAVYGDFDVAGDDGVDWPIALPAFDYERLLEQGYCTHLFALRREVALSAVRKGKSDMYRLFLSTLDDKPRDHEGIAHIPGSLATLVLLDPAAESQLLAQAVTRHLKARKRAAQIRTSSSSLFPAIRISRSIPAGLTTIVIPVRNQLGLLRSCLRSIKPAARRSNVDILVVDNDSSDPEMIAFLNDLKRGGEATIVSVAGPFNFARLNNVAAEGAKGDFLCLLNNDVEATDGQWLDEMLSRLADDDVGAVGALLVWPSGVVQHGGTVLGANFAAAHAFSDRMQTDPGYADMLNVAHECSAVTAACMLTRRRDYLDIGGMDELHFPVNFNDVDYCVRLRAAGKRVVFTPHARLYHLESASRGRDEQPVRAARFARELQHLRARWGEWLMTDPYYNPTLSLDAIPFSALAWPPRSRDPRINRAPIAAHIPPGF
jgi:O-antigen biosynthesis protein